MEPSGLDRAVETLAAAGLTIVMGTPTATPPKWLVDRMPDMIAALETIRGALKKSKPRPGRLRGGHREHGRGGQKGVFHGSLLGLFGWVSGFGCGRARG